MQRISTKNPKLTYNIANTSARYSRDSKRQSQNTMKQHSVPASASPGGMNALKRKEKGV